MARLHLVMAGILILGPVVATPAAASGADAGSAVTPLEVAPAPDAVGAPPSAPFARVAVVDDGALASVTGKADMQVLEQIVNAQNTGTVTDNTMNGDFTTGMIAIAGGSFDNFNGLALMSVNTGNNVSINSSMSVNVAFQH